MKTNEIKKFETIQEFHRYFGLPAPEHPHISIISIGDMYTDDCFKTFSFSFFSSIAFKSVFKGKMQYGQSTYDFDKGMMSFVSPDQIFSFQHEEGTKHSGWIILIHSDFLWNTPLEKNIKSYDFFDYSVNEALFLSDAEQKIMLDILELIKQEYHARIDKFSKEIIIAQLELLLKYAQRFYERQFITRDKPNHLILSKLENFINHWFDSGEFNGLPTVQIISDHLNISPSYLSRLLHSLIGQSTQQYLQKKLIDKAKERLAHPDLSVSEVAYELGFEHPQSFNKLFKKHTELTPSEFKKSLN